MGNVGGYHSAVTVRPTGAYGVVLLMAGAFPDAAELAHDAYAILQPAIDAALADAAAALYAGEWRAEGSAARIAVDDGTLYIDRLTLHGQDALATLGAQGRIALRETRTDEFRWVRALARLAFVPDGTLLLMRRGRVDIGEPPLNGKRHAGCMPYWTELDEWGMRNNAAINAIYFSGTGRERKLHVPSLSVVMTRED